MLEIIHNAPLAPLCSFRVGGNADDLAQANSSEELLDLLRTKSVETILGYGCNVVISDHGLRGLTVVNRLKGQDSRDKISAQDNLVIAEAGVWWSDFTSFAANNGLWGVELTHGVPGSIGAAVVGNIACYGQAVSDTLKWIEIYDKSSHTTKTIFKSDLKFGYRYSVFAEEAAKVWTILRAAFELSESPTTDLKYQKALDAAQEINADTSTLEGRLRAITRARELAGALYDPSDEQPERTAGSFFKNPTVNADLADYIMSFEEHGVSKDQIKVANAIHGGDSQRVSAALVLLAAGFKRGQEFGRVRLHPKSVLKIENFDNCTAGEIYDCAMKVKEQVKSSLGIELECEVKFLGRF